MAEIISFSIDLQKIDKSKINNVTRKDGTLARFIDVSVVINDEQDTYGNIASMSLGQSKSEVAAKTPKVYLGNGKRVWASNAANKTQEQPQSNSNNSSDDLPF